MDLEGSRCYAVALSKCGILTQAESESLVEGLHAVEAEWRAGTFEIQPADEDIHTANERRLGELIGAVAGKLHTGRSRNDQVATDVRLWLKEEIVVLQRELHNLIQTASSRAAQEAELLMPGYTHLQPAQLIRWVSSKTEGGGAVASAIVCVASRKALRSAHQRWPSGSNSKRVAAEPLDAQPRLGLAARRRTVPCLDTHSPVGWAGRVCVCVYGGGGW
eukprot:SAG11_NODE_2023_length_3910_cov_3.261349_3_plen_219_part_00